MYHIQLINDRFSVKILIQKFRFTYNGSPTSDGSAAAILCSERMVKKYNLQSKAIKIVGMEMRTDYNSTFTENSCIKMVRNVDFKNDNLISMR